MNIRAQKWITSIAGSHRVAIVDMRQTDSVIRIRDVVTIDGLRCRVTGIECSRLLTNPPRMHPIVGLVVNILTPVENRLRAAKAESARSAHLYASTTTPIPQFSDGPTQDGDTDE